MSSMTMAGARMTGEMDKNKILRRFQNLLNLTYLQAEPVEGGGYRIPEKVFESIQTELDFSPPDSVQKRKAETQIKKRYRQRSSYRFWKESLDLANIGNYPDAKEFLLNIFRKLDNSRHYGSMTHSRYALETLELALDDVYGTNKLVLSQYQFRKPSAPNKTPKKSKSQAKAGKSKSSKAQAQPVYAPF